jgi:hypothetical protein
MRSDMNLRKHWVDLLGGLPASSKRPTEQRVHHIGGARCLVVDQTE